MAPTTIRVVALGLWTLVACHTPRTSPAVSFAPSTTDRAAWTPNPPDHPGALTARSSLATGGTVIETQDELPPPASLEDLQRLALATSPALAAAQAEADARTAAIDAAGALPEPRVTWTEYLEPVETRVGPVERQLMVQQALPWGGAREAQRMGARAAAQGAAAAHDDAVARLRATVEAAAWRRARARALAELAREGALLHDAIRADVDSRYRTGAAEFADLLRAGDEVALAEERVAAAVDRFERQTAVLEAAVGLTGLGDLDLALAPAPVGLEQRLMRRLAETERWIVEGAAGVALAAARRLASDYAGRKVAVVLCGRNIKLETFLEAVA